MTEPGRSARATLISLLLAAAPAVAGWAQTAGKQALGLCPPAATRLDSYMQALCDGEAALQAGNVGAAMERFRAAAALPRADASNELAWAGLAVAHCRARDIDAGRRWAEHFSQARQLWLGQLDCAASGEDPRARLSPFVRSRMCTEQLAADYAAVRGNPHSAHVADLHLRLQRIDESIAAACAAPSAQQAGAGDRAGSEASKKKASQKRGRRATSKPKRGEAPWLPAKARATIVSSERPASPARGR